MKGAAYAALFLWRGMSRRAQQRPSVLLLRINLSKLSPLSTRWRPCATASKHVPGERVQKENRSMSRTPTLASSRSDSASDTNNESAIAKAYARWRLPLLRGLARFKHSIGSAEDALHDGVVKWVAADPALTSPDEQGAYLRKTVLNGVADEFRDRQAGRRLQTVSYDEAADEGQTLMAGDSSCPMHAAAHQQRLARLAEAMQELPERQREAFVLSRFDGLTQDEVAARMQISRRMVVKHLARAIAYCEVRVHYATAAQMHQLHRPAADQRGDDHPDTCDAIR